MNDFFSTFSNNLPPLLGPNPGEPSCTCPISTEPLNLGISIYAPVSSVPGSATFFMLQPLLRGKVFASIGVLIAAQVFLFLTDRFWGLESLPLRQDPVIAPEQTVQMSLKDLQDFLASLPAIQSSSGHAASKIFPPETPEIPLAITLTVWGNFSNNPFSPTIYLLLPLLTFPNVRGALPLMILELLTTIFVRAVVPPQTTGSKPVTNPTTINPKFQSLQFSPEDLLNLLNRFSKHFGT
jgi:hypothetical protein